MNKLKQELQRQRLTNSALARELTKITGMEISRQRINNWTQNKHLPRFPMMKKIADYLEVTIEELFYNEYEEKQ